MKTLKFGGTSLANAEKFIQVSTIILNQCKNDQISVVLSAPATITNQLEQSIHNCIKNKKVPKKKINTIKTFFLNIIHDIYSLKKKYLLHKTKKKIIKNHNKLKQLLNKIKFLDVCPDKIQAKIISMGEILSITIMKELLIHNDLKITIINPVKVIRSNNKNYLNAIVNINKSKKNFKKLNISKKDIILMPGFIAGNKLKELVVLGRNGSDYSAAILSICTNAHTCEIWTDVNGIYTADPKFISTSKTIAEITYQEALELAYFGAKIIHPSSIEPLRKYQIKCVIKNTYNPNHAGTVINQKNHKNSDLIKGITYLKKMVFIKIFSKSNYSIKNIALKIFKYLFKNNITAYLSNQSFLYNTISFYITENHYDCVIKKLKKKLDSKIQKKILEPILILKNLCILSVIGSNIKKNNKNILKKICLIVQSFNKKILAISQNLSDISLSIVLKNKKIVPITRKIHDIIIYKTKPINIFLIGIGGVGLELLKIFSKQHITLKKELIDFNINVIANSKTYITNKKTICLNTWKEEFHQSKKKFFLNKILKLAKKNGFIYPILIDCTASQEISNQYNHIIKSGFHIITANKKSNTSSLTEYIKIRKTAKKYKKKFFYETHVGAGLPVIHTLQNLMKSGDKLIKFQGILSGSISYIFGKLDSGYTLSEATKKAQELGFTEPHPKDDLNGMDIARKLLIIAREAGYFLELSDIKIEKILPSVFNKIIDKKKFFFQLQHTNNIYIQKTKIAQQEKKVLRCIGTIQKNGNCSIKIRAVDYKNPLYHIKNGENIFVFYTKYYKKIPLIIRGYGAGHIVTASGIFSDLLRMVL